MSNTTNKQILCERKVCRVPLPNPRWWNTSTRAYYCRDCFDAITHWPENSKFFEDHKPKPVLFLDVDGVMLGFPSDKECYDKFPFCRPANRLYEFMVWATDNMDCRWLTSWALTGTMQKDRIQELSNITGVPVAILEKFNHHHPWFTNKTYAIDATEFLGGKLAFWLDDDYCKDEQEILKRWGLERIYMRVDTSQDPDALIEALETIKRVVQEEEV